jgi:hypothetical protein
MLSGGEASLAKLQHHHRAASDSFANNREIVLLHSATRKHLLLHKYLSNGAGKQLDAECFPLT